MSRSNPDPNPSESARVTLSRVAARTPDGRTLFENLSLAFGRERTGLVGRNGAGKSTLLRIVAGESATTEGAVARAGSVGVLAQRFEPAPDERVADTLGMAEKLAVIERITAGQGSADDLDAADWMLPDRAAAALAEVGLEGLSLDQLTASLSGGEQTRLRLARLMTEAPDLLVLDEPTNHLDAEARDLVAAVLGRWKGGVLVASHDRGLLNRMDRIIELSSLGVAVHGGGYDLYAEAKAAERAAAVRALAVAERGVETSRRVARQAEEARARRDRVGRAFASKGSEPKILLGAMARRAEASAGRETRLADRAMGEAVSELEMAGARVERVRSLDIPMPPSGLAAGRTALKLAGAEWRSPGGRRIAGPIDLSLIGPERVAVTGANGAGKSTLLKLAAGRLSPSDGSVERRVRTAMLDQDADVLRADETLVEAFRRLNPETAPNEARAALARFLFRNSAGERIVGSLSGGERLRAALACVVGGAEPAQLLILDEPTNHLDLESVTAIEAALRAWDGALLVVSHDAAFLEAIGVERQIAL
ncbi:ABC transporter [Brevundimonas sp. Leaf363]|uniref:ABC-F family ATP-binding cassette domain-containing protein n=1 Tax=Brevundimonas sp. Leaf363 TaxID=1736353 RepID=UPI0006FA86FF|nr:ABC-F family ATP-binding cassette domain-containing protein [Brevundimonas sp. Leaf363]KQS56150.1 ABC transporter [Brevundimonas sp. Leaf363]